MHAYLVAGNDLEGIEELGAGLRIGVLVGHECNILIKRDRAVA